MSDNINKACVAIILAIALKKRSKRKKWMKYWFKQREKYTHLNLLNQIREYQEMDDYENYFRMPDARFEHLLELITPYLIKKDTIMRKAITVREKLALTLHYLSTWRYFKNMRFAEIMSSESVSQAIISTCEALTYVLREYIKVRKNFMI